MTKRNSYTVELRNGGFGQIQFFLTVPGGGDSMIHLAIIIPLPPRSQHSLSSVSELGSFLIPVQRSSGVAAVPIHEITRKCLYIDIESLYVCKIPNFIEKD